ncbi:MAG: fumarylacetoacetate hydrolase family protein [Candidatus Flexifilum sp.]|jgi:2-keto-4-pentenoate hydratase/2-oxohepta-3-ene-1,7-dioic acid hydratase in catechol pathway
MKLVSFTFNGRRRIGVVTDQVIQSLAWADSLGNMLRSGVTPNRISETFPLDKVTINPPLMPSKIIGIGLNYADHARETGKEPPAEPLIFAKFPSAIIGHQDVIRWQRSITDQVDWEGELAVVIGRRARHVREEDAFKYVFGYTCANDVSARDLQFGKDSQWTRAKSLDTFCPIGPYIVTRDEIDDPHALAITTLVNDEVMQQGNTRDLIFSIPQLVAYCSRMFTLEPGDLILTGTPAGVGRARKPPRFLADGDRVTVRIDGIGELSNTCQVMPEENAG